MRTLFVTLLSAMIGLGFLTTGALAQEKKPPQDPEKVLADLLMKVKIRDQDKLQIRIDAIMALADFGPKAEPALPDLIAALKEKNEDLRLNAHIALARIGKPALKEVAALLDTQDDNLRFYAVWTLGTLGPDAKAYVPKMIELLSDKNMDVRRKAAFALGRMGDEPKKTIAALVIAFKDEKEEVRQAAGEALSKFGKDAVPPLIGLLKSDNVAARHQAATSLGAIGADAKTAVPALKELFLAMPSINQDQHHYAQVLAKIGGKESVAALEAGLKDNRLELRQAAAQSLQQVGADAVPVLLDAMGSKDVDTRRLAAMTLSQMQIGDKSVVIAFAYALSDTDDNVRQHALNGLSSLGPQAKQAAPKLRDALVDLNPNVRQQAYYILQRMNENPQAGLKKGLESKDAKVRINTASLMVSVGYDVQSATPVLVEGLKNEDLGLRMQAASTLANVRKELDLIIPIFIDGLGHKAMGVRIQAAQGLQNVGAAGGEKARKALVKSLEDPEAQVRQHSLWALQNQGELKTILPELVKLAKDKDAGIRGNIPWLLSRAGDEGLPPLGIMLKDSDVNVRINASNVLRQIGTRAAKVMPALKEAALKDENAQVRLNAMMALAFGGGEGPKFLVERFADEKDANNRVNLYNSLVYNNNTKQHALPLVKTGMKDASPVVRQSVINSLYQLGANSPEGFEAFAIGLKDSDVNVRQQAAWTANLFGAKTHDPLESALKGTKDAGFRQVILQAMMNTQYKAKTGIGPISDCLKDDNVSVRFNACNLLANIGPDAADALPRLRELTKDPQQFIQNAAKNAITQIEKNKQK